MSPRLPEHPVLAAVAGQLERYGWAGFIADHEMRLVWVSSEFQRIYGIDVDVERWYGSHLMEFTLSKEMVAKSTERSVLRAGLDGLPMLIDRTPGGREAMRDIMSRILGVEAASIVDRAPDHQDPVWATSVTWASAEGMPPVKTSVLTTNIHDRAGGLIGVASVFVAPLPFRLVTALARGDEAALERMARLAKPGRHSAAILFADMQSSGLLSRRLPSAVYFRVVRSLITAIDESSLAVKDSSAGTRVTG